MLPKDMQNKDVVTIDGAQEKTERIENWKKKRSKISCDFVYKQEEPTENKTTKIIAEFKNKEATQEQETIDHLATTCAATGSGSHEYSNILLTTTMSGFFTNDYFNAQFTANAVRDALLAMKPADEYEGMLCSRLLVLHSQYMNFMARVTNNEQTSHGIDLNINRATKLMRLYNETLEALNKYRRKGEQKVTVQHVNVGNGGQAVVAGNFQQGGEGSGKK